MGVSELVLKVPPEDPPRPQETVENQPPPPPKSKKPTKSAVKNKTHSRESSGASNLSVRFTVNDETVCTEMKSDNEDITLSDRLSQDLDEDDGFHPGSKSCESIPNDRLTPYGADGGLRMLPCDSKSQNSDYGSFCHTPSDTFGGDSNSPRPPPAPATPGGETEHGDTQRQPLLPSNEDDTSSDDDAGANSSGYMRRKTKLHRNTSENTAEISSVSDTESMANGANIKGEPIKTLLAGIFLVFAWVATTTSLALTHERVPDYEPLPDLVLDNIVYQNWGLDASEIVIMICTLVAFLVSIFHKHRFIVLRRIFLLVGIHYYYRAITMYVTVLPKPNSHYTCAPKANETTAFVIFQRVLKLLSGMGLSINGKHIYCGDYIYSGHTMTLIMTYLVIKEYSPKKWYLLHYSSLALTSFGIVALLLARGHYSIDVLVAYWVTTRLWWMYHTLTKHEVLRHSDNSDNHLNKMWWWYLFTYFEGRVPTQLPREYGWPLPQKLLNLGRNRQNLEDPEAGLGNDE